MLLLPHFTGEETGCRGLLAPKPGSSRKKALEAKFSGKILGTRVCTEDVGRTWGATSCLTGKQDKASEVTSDGLGAAPELKAGAVLLNPQGDGATWGLRIPPTADIWTGQRHLLRKLLGDVFHQNAETENTPESEEGNSWGQRAGQVGGGRGSGVERWPGIQKQVKRKKANKSEIIIKSR